MFAIIGFVGAVLLFLLLLCCIAYFIFEENIHGKGTPQEEGFNDAYRKQFDDCLEYGDSLQINNFSSEGRYYIEHKLLDAARDYVRICMPSGDDAEGFLREHRVLLISLLQRLPDDCRVLLIVSKLKDREQELRIQQQVEELNSRGRKMCVKFCELDPYSVKFVLVDGFRYRYQYPASPAAVVCCNDRRTGGLFNKYFEELWMSHAEVDAKRAFPPSPPQTPVKLPEFAEKDLQHWRNFVYYGPTGHWLAQYEKRGIIQFNEDIALTDTQRKVIKDHVEKIRL